MSQRVEDINDLVQLINDEKKEIINKVNELNQSAEISEILNIALPQIEILINNNGGKTLQQISDVNDSLKMLISRQENLSTSEEVDEIFSSLKTDVNNFHDELLNQHRFLESVSEKLSKIFDDKSDRDEIIKNILTIKADVETFNRSLEASVIEINSNLQNILKHILTMDTTEQNDIIKRELENIFLTTNGILSTLEISDKKNEEVYNVISSVETKIDELIAKEPVSTIKAINDLQTAIDEKFAKTSADISETGINFETIAKTNLGQILSDIGKSSAKIEALNETIRDDFAKNLEAIKHLVENISIDTPAVNPENTALSGKLDAIHKAVSSLNIPESSNLELNIEQQAAVLKSSLESIKDTLHSMQNNNDANNAVTEKLVSLETAISEGIKQYDDNIISLNNKINEYISSILKLGEITDSKLDDSVTGLTELKFEIKGIVETINDISSKTNNKVDNAIDSFKLIDETLREKLEDITNTIRINEDSTVNHFENINNNVNSNFETVNEKLDSFSSSMDEKLNQVTETITQTSAGITSALSNADTEAVNKFNLLYDNLNNVNDTIRQTSENVHLTLGNTENAIHEQFSLVNEKISSSNTQINEELEKVSSNIGETLTKVNENVNLSGLQINEKLDNVSSMLEIKMSNIGEAFNQTSDGINTVLTTTENTIQDKVNIVNETILTNSNSIKEKVDNSTAILSEKIKEQIELVNDTLSGLPKDINTAGVNIQNTLNEVNENVKLNNSDLSKKIENINTSIADNFNNINLSIDTTSYNIDTKLAEINSVMTDYLKSVDESLSSNTASMTSVSENVSSSLQNGLNSINDELKTNNLTINEKLENVNTTLTKQLDSMQEVLTEHTEKFNTKVDVLTGGLLEQLNNTSQVLGTNSNNINATVEDLSHSMKDCMDNITETFNASSQNINNKVDDIDTNLKVRLDEVNTVLTGNLTEINSILGNLNSSVEGKLDEINSNVKLDVNAVKDCFDSALSALDMVRSDIIEKTEDNNDALTELINNAIKDIQTSSNSISSEELEEKFSNLREHILAVILELQSRQEELIGISKLNDERNVQALDEITESIKNVEANIQNKSTENKKILEEKLTELKSDVATIQQMITDDGTGLNEKIFNKLYTVENIITEASEKYEEKITALNDSLSSYINDIQKNAEDTEIKLGNSVSEISELKDELQKIAEDINSIDNSQDVKFYELTENINSKIGDIVDNISGIKDIVELGLKDDIKQNLAALDAKFDNLFNGLKILKNLNLGGQFNIPDFEERLNTIKQEVNLVNTDIIETIDTKTSAIIENFMPVRDAVSQILDFDFNKIITEVKTQVELSYLNLNSDLNNNLTTSQEAITKMEAVFHEVAKKITAIDDQVTEFSKNNLEILNLTIENINKVVEKNLDETSALSAEWRTGISEIEEKLAVINSENEQALKKYLVALKHDLQQHINTNFDDLKALIPIAADNQDALDSIDILQNELTVKMETMESAILERLADSNNQPQTENIQKISTDLKAFVDKVLINFAKHIENAVTQNNLKAEDIEKLTVQITQEWDANISEKIKSLNNEMSVHFDELLNKDEKIQETLQALHDKVDILALSDNSGEDILFEIEDIKNILTKVSDKSEFNDLLNKINSIESSLGNSIEENTAKNTNDIKESVMSAIIAVFDQISFVEETEDIKDFVEEKTDEINQNLLEVRNQLKQIGVGDFQDYSYTLQDVESDIAKLRMVLNEMSQTSSSDDVMEILYNIRRISNSIDGLQASLTTDQIYELKNDVERLNEDIVSISTRTNKLLLTSDDSYKALNNGLDEFSKVILKLEERINILDNTKNSERIEKKLDNVNAMVSVIANSGKVMNQVMMYLGEWIDTTSENIGAISEKTAEIDEIKEIITDLRDAMPSKASILKALENRFEEQQQRLDRLEMKFDRALALLEDREDARLNKKFERIEKQMTKLSMNIEKLASYVDE